MKRCPAHHPARSGSPPAGLILSLLVCSSPSMAAVQSFQLQWSGEAFSNTATATGLLRIDDTVLPNPGTIAHAIQPFVEDFRIAVEGASAGNGSFDLSRFDDFLFASGSLALDLGRELVGQDTGQDPWGSIQLDILGPDVHAGDFNVFADFDQGTDAPEGLSPFVLAANGGTAESMLLTSFRPVPLPAALYMLAMGLLGLAAWSSRKSVAQA